MKIPKILYHGSSKKLKGKFLLLSQGEDSDERPQNKQFGVYATDIKEIAITMALITSKGVVGGSIDQFKKPYGAIYGGFPKQKYIYLYYLSSENFKPTKGTKHQFISKISIKPIKIEKIEAEKYFNLIRIATKEETYKWKKKYLN